MKRYDPIQGPGVDDWVDLDEQERINLVLQYHRKACVDLPNARMHAIMHVIVENQCAMGDELPVLRTVERLRTEGLDRHDAIHAAGSILAGRIYDILKGQAQGNNANQEYWSKLEALTARAWRDAR